jgi:hypothetical protein
LLPFTIDFVKELCLLAKSAQIILLLILFRWN